MLSPLPYLTHSASLWDRWGMHTRGHFKVAPEQGARASRPRSPHPQRPQGQRPVWHRGPAHPGGGGTAPRLGQQPPGPLVLIVLGLQLHGRQPDLLAVGVGLQGDTVTSRWARNGSRQGWSAAHQEQPAGSQAGPRSAADGLIPAPPGPTGPGRVQPGNADAPPHEPARFTGVDAGPPQRWGAMLAVAQPSPPGCPEPLRPLKARVCHCHPTRVGPTCSFSCLVTRNWLLQCPCGQQRRRPKGLLTAWRGLPGVRALPRTPQSPVTLGSALAAS